LFCSSPGQQVSSFISCKNKVTSHGQATRDKVKVKDRVKVKIVVKVTGKV
jgi:hypothetical protein